MLQSVLSVFVVYRRKTLTGPPDPKHANGTDKPCSRVKLMMMPAVGFTARVNPLPYMLCHLLKVFTHVDSPLVRHLPSSL